MLNYTCSCFFSLFYFLFSGFLYNLDGGDQTKASFVLHFCLISRLPSEAEVPIILSFNPFPHHVLVVILGNCTWKMISFFFKKRLKTVKTVVYMWFSLVNIGGLATRFAFNAFMVIQNLLLRESLGKKNFKAHFWRNNERIQDCLW